MTSTEPRTVDRTDPYPWPYAGLPGPDRIALVVAGADEHWIARCPASAVVDAAERLVLVATTLRAVGGAVVHVTHGIPARAPVVGSPYLQAASLHEPDDLVVAAGGIDGFFGSTLDRDLRALGCDHLIIGGFGLEAPVHSTLRSANDQGYECLLLTDASAALDERQVATSLSMVTMSGGIFGALGASDDLVTALSDHPLIPAVRSAPLEGAS